MELFLQQAILGMIQGIVEWLPFSSEGMLLLANTHFFGETNLELFIRQALFLHLGTFFAALIYFRKDIKELLIGLKNYSKTDVATRKTLNFLIIATIISGFVGLAFLQFFKFVNTELILTSKLITFSVGFLLLLTGLLHLKIGRRGIRTFYHLKNFDSIFLGFVQGIAVMPGLSRSGLTISALLFRKIDETTALKLSFIMSLPIVLIGNILLNLHDFTFVLGMLWGFAFAFMFGLITIHLLMRLSKRLRFGHFVIFIALLTIAAGFL